MFNQPKYFDMKKYIPLLALFETALLLTAGGDSAYSQTTGTFSFTVTTTSTGGFSPEHLIAIWIENNGATFIKTKMKYGSSGNNDHLGTWVSKSGLNVVDAITGATLTSHGTLSFLWNGTNVAGTLVPDGTYNVWLEMAWASSLTTGKTVNNYAFTKGPVLFTSNPPNTANFLSLGLTWTPSSTPVEPVLENGDIKVYPNPTSGILNIEFKKAADVRLISVINEAGNKVFEEKTENSPVGLKTFDFSNLAPGPYFMVLHTFNNDITFMFVRTK
jgi:hypothetical protein